MCNRLHRPNAFCSTDIGADLLIKSISIFVFSFAFYYCGRLIYSYYLSSHRHSECSLLTMFASVSSSGWATCPNTEMHQQDRRWDSEIRPARCSTSSFRTRSYRRILRTLASRFLQVDIWRICPLWSSYIRLLTAGGFCLVKNSIRHSRMRKAGYMLHIPQN